jgi:glycosyltransferase involved in cell wall biosynthesis
MISVIIPAYKATRYIDECLASIKGDCEILIGVDGCEETYNHIKHLENVYYFTKNVGPYIIRNTLSNIAKGDVIVFFDSDDVMVDGLLNIINERTQNVDYIPLNYINFQEKIKTSGHIMSDAVIAIKKNVLNQLNGFYPWRCGADTEFAHRLEYNNFKRGKLEDVSYYRRLHGENLTMRKDLGHGSSIRNQYCNIINTNIKNKSWPNPQTKTIETYVKN